MICEAILLGALGSAIYYRTNLDEIIVKSKMKEIIKKWWRLLDAKGSSSYNNINDEFQILDIIPTHFGWNMVILIPYGKEYNDILKLVNDIEHVYKAEIRSILSSNRNTAYISVHPLEKQINTIENIKFKLSKQFKNS